MEFLLPGDPLPKITLAILLTYVGRLTVQADRRTDGWGLKVAYVVFVCYLAGVGWSRNARTGTAWTNVSFYGLITAWISLGAAWIVLPILTTLHRLLIAAPLHKLRYWRASAYARREEERARRERELRAERERAAWEAAAPERERQRLLSEEEASRRLEAQRRRDDARASALLSYTFYAAKLGGRFSRADFDLYLANYMGDSLSPAVVEQRGRDLLAIFERHLADVQPPQREQTIEGLTAWYEATKGRIEQSSMDDRTKRTQLAELYGRYTELMSELMERLRP